MRTLRKSRRSAHSLETLLAQLPETRSVFAERVAGGYFVDFELKRDQLARYGLSVADAQNVVMSAIGGENVTTTIEGRARYPVNVRYARELRDNLERLGQVLVPTPSGAPDPHRANRRHQTGQRTFHDPGRKRHAGWVRFRGPGDQ